MKPWEEDEELMRHLHERVRKGERGVLGEVGGFLFYGENQPGISSGRLAGYRVARAPFKGSATEARAALLRTIPLPVLECAAYLEVLSVPIPEEPETMANFSQQQARKRGDHGPSLVVKDRGGTGTCFLTQREGAKTHKDLEHDRAHQLKQ